MVALGPRGVGVVWAAFEPCVPGREEVLRPLGCDRIVGIDLSDASVDASIHKAPSGGDAPGKSPVDWGESWWKRSLSADRDGIPAGWVADGANRSGQALLAPTPAAADQRGLIFDVETLHLDRAYTGNPDTIPTLAAQGPTWTAPTRGTR